MMKFMGGAGEVAVRCGGLTRQRYQVGTQLPPLDTDAAGHATHHDIIGEIDWHFTLHVLNCPAVSN